MRIRSRRRESGSRRQLHGRLKAPNRQRQKKFSQSKSLRLELSRRTVSSMVRRVAAHKVTRCTSCAAIRTASNSYKHPCGGAPRCTLKIQCSGTADFKQKGKEPFGAEPIPDIFPCLFSFLHLSVTDNKLISSHTTPTHSIMVPGVRVHFHKIFFVRMRKWANYPSAKTPRRTVDPEADSNDLN